MVVSCRPCPILGEGLIDFVLARVSAQNAARVVHFLDIVGSVIEVVRSAERPGFLDASAAGIELEGGRAAVRSRHNGLRQAILEVPGEASALGRQRGYCRLRPS